MDSNVKKITRLIVALCGFAVLAQSAIGQSFTYQNNDLLIGFRKTGSFQANYEMVVDVGQVTNYLSLAAGATVKMPNFSPTQLSDAFPNTNLNNLNFSVLAGDAARAVAGYPLKTIWATVPRTNVAVQSTAPSRLPKSTQQITANEIFGILYGAAFISGTIGTSNQDNTASLVREPINTDSDLSVYVASQLDSTLSTLHDTWPQNVEITTPGNFNTPVRCDFYEVRPIGFLDPHTGLTNGPAYYVGYLELSPDGTMTFTKGVSTMPPPVPPAPTLVSVSHSGETSTIYFTTTNGATYTLYYTNASGLGAPVSSWGVSSASLVGDGGTNSLSDTTVEAVRFYRVGAR